MTIFIELVTDAFEDNLTRETGIRGGRAGSRSARAGNVVARRPTRGIEIKEDTYASIKVILSDGSELPLVDSSQRSGVSSNGYSNFMLQNVQEARMEKHQIVETFGASYIFFFGENPRFLDVTATIINSHDFNWEAEWWENYNENFRGTKLVEKGGRLYMFYDDTIVEGYMLMCQATKNSEQPHLINISFRLYLTNYRNISFIGSPQFPVHESAIIVDGSDNANPSGGRIFGPPSSQPGNPFAPTPQLSEALAQAAQSRGVSIRSLIADNLDEYVGLTSNSIASGFSASSGNIPTLSPAARALTDADDLNQETINQLGAHGADVNNPQSLSDLGMMPNFESDARSPATFRPKEKEPFGFDTGKEDTGPGGESGTSFSTGLSVDPLGAIFGGSTVTDRSGDNRFTEGAGDAKYGFRSAFAIGAGFGETGYGDFGGPGFGSGQGAVGDPGFKDPTQFSFAGVSQHKAAFDKFRKPRTDQSSFGKGAGIGSASNGLTGGASVRVGGKVSAFSLTSVGGTLRL